MTSDRHPLVNKLILGVLSLILVCLVLLVIRAYERDRHPNGPVEIAQAPDQAVPEATRAPLRSSPPRQVSGQHLNANAPEPTAGQPSPEEIPSPPADVESAWNSSSAQGAHLSGGSTGRSGTRRETAGGASIGAALPGIYGIVSLSGTPRPEIPIDLGPSCGRLRTEPPTTRHFVVGPKGELADVFVFISQGVSNRFVSTAPPPLLDQIGCMFEPYVIAVPAGRPFFIRNSDPELHNVHATPRLNREFNFAQVSGGPVVEKTFSTPELSVRIKCDVHPWMFAYVGVFEHPFFAVTDTNGVFSLPQGFPSGRYTVTASHLRAGAISQEIVVRPGEQKGLAFQLSVPTNLSGPSQSTAR